MRKTTALLLLMVATLLACTSARRSLYLSDAAAYFTDTVHKDMDDETLLEFLEYSTYFHMISDTDRVEKQNRPGVILSAKNTAYLNWNGDAAFGGEGDTCWIHYRTNNEQVSVGRSAAVSAFNFFNKESLGNNPEEYFTSKELNGSIKLGHVVVPFHFHQRKTEGWKSRGWIELNRDSFFLEPATYAASAASASSRMGLQVVDKSNNPPIAAIDLYNKPRHIYIRKNLPKDQRAILAAYLFILLSYL